MKNFHLAGIIPLAHPPFDFEMPWHDCLMPIDKKFLAIERSVLECAIAGCETIWIVAHRDIIPLLRYKIGEKVLDPASYRPFEKWASLFRKNTPIYYVAIHPKDRDKRDGMMWSILYGAYLSKRICTNMSAYVSPKRYFVSFPYGVYDPFFLRDFRTDLSSDKDFFISYEQKTVKDGEYLAFTFDEVQSKEMRKLFKLKATGYKDTSPESPRDKFNTPTKILPIEERWSGRFLSLEDIIGEIKTRNSTLEVEIDWYHNISSWENYRAYLSSNNRFEKPWYDYIKINEFDWGPVGYEEI